MRKLGLSLLVAASVLASASIATATPPSAEPTTDAKLAAAWLSTQTNADGLIESGFFNPLSLSAQAVIAFTAAGVGGSQVQALLDQLAAHFEDVVVNPGADANSTADDSDDPGALAYVILAAEAGHRDPTHFGPGNANLVARLAATRRTTGVDAGLYGAADPTFDGATRQGLALLALAAADVVAPPDAVTWLTNQQCPAANPGAPTLGSLWSAYRATPASACAIDFDNFTGPDTNSSALAILGLHAQGQLVAAATGAAALGGVRTSTGGWGFFADSTQTADASSTGLVVEAIIAATGHSDPQGVAQLLALQVGCAGDPADRGALQIADFTSGDLVPDALGTIQAIPALAGKARPDFDGTSTPGFPSIADTCNPATTTSTSTTTSSVPSGGSTTTTSSTTTSSSTPSSTSTTSTSVAGATTTSVLGNRIPRTGAASGPLLYAAGLFAALGLVALGQGKVRSARR